MGRRQLRYAAGKFYVYTHTRPDTGEVFYVGKGRGPRAYNLARNAAHARVVNKLLKKGLSVQIDIVKTGLLESAAFALEKSLIAQYGRANLTNLSDGGGGPNGLQHTEEFKEALRERNRILQFGGGFTRGRTFPEWHRAKLREAIANRSEAEAERLREVRRSAMLGNSHTLGHKLSEEHKAKISISQFGKPKLRLRGRKLSVEHRVRLSAAKKGVPKNPEHRAKLAEHCRELGRSTRNRKRLAARNQTPEARARSAEVQRQRWARWRLEHSQAVQE